MKIFICTLFFLIFNSYISYSQSNSSLEKKLENFELVNFQNSDFPSIKPSVEKASGIFQKYFNDTPPNISLYHFSTEKECLDTRTDKVNEAASLYLVFEKAPKTEKDTLKLTEETKRKYSKDAIVILNCQGEFLRIIDDGSFYYMASHNKFSLVDIDKSCEKKKTFSELTDDEIKRLTLIQLNTFDINKEIAFKYFLLTNIYHHYYKYNEVFKEEALRAWPITFLLIDACELDKEVPKSEMVKSEFNSVFQSNDYRVSDNSKNKTTRFLLPRNIDRWGEEYIGLTQLGYNKALELHNYRFKVFIPWVSYLKSRYGDEVIKKIVDYYFTSDTSTYFLITPFLKDNYSHNTNIKEIKADFNKWLNEKS